MKQHWSIDITIDHEWEQEGGIAVDSFRIQQVQSANNAVEALSLVIVAWRKRYSIPETTEADVTRIDIMLTQDRE